MNIFESVRFLDEGQQAEEYKARKEKEKEDNSPFSADHERRHTAKYGEFPSDKYDNSPGTKKVEKELNKRMWKALDSGDNKPYHNALTYSTHASDAAERHMRRHPEYYKEAASCIIENLKMI